MPISRMQQPRQLYGLGSFVKSIGKGVKKAVGAVKDVAKSDIGKVALLYGATAGLGALGAGAARAGSGLGIFAPSNVLANLGTSYSAFKATPFGEKIFGRALTDYGTREGGLFSKLGGKAGLGIAAASLAGGMFTAQEQEYIEELRESGDPEKLKGYLRRYYRNLNPSADQIEVENFVRANAAYGGRMKYANGSDEDAKRAERVKELMDDGYEFGEAVKQAMKEGYAQGGRIEENVDQASGIMGLPQRTNAAGVKELDLRKSGGFIPPVGVKEKADDIPAMLSNNEFVFTADAVRGMGDGDVNMGAQRMYNMMKKLEKDGRVA